MIWIISFGFLFSCCAWHVYLVAIFVAVKMRTCVRAAGSDFTNGNGKLILILDFEITNGFKKNDFEK